ncbi:fibronectin type III-like domain-contianing protein [Robertmurraya sp. P23]
MAGEETAQVYIKPATSSVFRVNKELKGFAKVNC